MGKTCGILVSHVKKGDQLQKIFDDSELWRFTSSWIGRFQDERESNVMEKFIFLWVTFNAWGSLVVPDKSKNHQDIYIIHQVSADSGFNDYFRKKYEKDKQFKEKCDKLIEYAPVFQVIWLRNNQIQEWDIQEESRSDYIHRLMRFNPYYPPSKDGDQPKPTFSPSCACSKHLDKGEPIPIDWPHVLHTIYQIRCNLFHGGKNYNSRKDRLFVDLAYSILWEVWSKEIPERILHPRGTKFLKHKIKRNKDSEEIRKKESEKSFLSWERTFVRTGFLFKFNGNVYDFSQENRYNIQYLTEVLKELNVDCYLKNCIFEPPHDVVDQSSFLAAMDTRKGMNNDYDGLENILLSATDTYISGIVRWINYIGIPTYFSCDGHGNSSPNLGVQKEYKDILDTSLSLATNGELSFRNKGFIIHKDRKRIPIQREILLDIAEIIYSKKEPLKKLVQSMVEVQYIK